METALEVIQFTTLTMFAGFGVALGLMLVVAAGFALFDLSRRD
jgi:hypothetical protein